MKKAKFYIPLKINGELGTNKIYAGVHWTKRNKDKLSIFLLVRSVIGTKNKAFENPVKLKMSFKSKLDVSNHSYLFKLIEDSLVKLGVLQDDTDKFVKQDILQKQNDFEGVIVEIEEM